MRDRYGHDDRRAWNRDWRRDTRYNWSNYRYRNRSVFHLPRYYAPYGWDYGYRRFSVGVMLSAPLFVEDYWIDDPWTYRLPEVYGPYRWVRYYNDALLVDVDSGEVVDVIYDIFW
ncbi:RcnB family protein [Sphingomonas sp. 66-10]|uniref:RcnB family protein n=1 Tax=Sphingomonas sp. 66-10 TaxID=1895848 RepID=UPI00257EC34D|nr:RcnB family protein [Sphingomonas sp. 66-10]